jgi:hypothetical protein
MVERRRKKKNIYQLVRIEDLNQDTEKDNDNNIHFLDFHIEHYENKFYIQQHLKLNSILPQKQNQYDEQIPGGIVVGGDCVACSG